MFLKNEQDSPNLNFISNPQNCLKFFHHFYSSLLLATDYPEKKGKEKKTAEKQIRESHRHMCQIASASPEEYKNKTTLIEAVIAQLEGNFEKAIQLYDQSIQISQKKEMQQDAVIACVRAAALCDSQGFHEIAEAYKTQCNTYFCPENGESSPMSISLSTEIINKNLSSTVISDSGSRNNDSIDTTMEDLDLSTVINASHVISSEIILERLLSQLLKILLENAGAERAFLLLDNDGSLSIHAMGSSEKKEIYQIPLQVESASGIPLSVVNYVKRTHETLVLDNAVRSGIFTSDPYIVSNNVKSIMCSPLLKQQYLRGIIYLENSLISGAFAQDRVELIKIISTQAAISLENSLLFEKEREIEMQLQEQFEEIQAQYEEMEAMNEELRETTTELFEANKNLAIFQKFTDESAQGMGMTRMDGTLTYANPSLAVVLGADDRISLSGKNLLDYYPDEIRVKVVEEIIPQVIEGKDWIGELEIGIDIENRTPLIQGFFTIKDSLGNPLFLATIVTNVLEQKRLEEQLFQAQKMEAIGTLAGGIAHDFNNLLTAIIGYCDMILLDMAPSDKHCFDMKEILKAAKRSSSLTQQLLAFSRKQILVPVLLDVNIIVRDMTKMLSRLIGENVNLTTLLMEKTYAINADRGQIEQVIMNLIVNARDAMPDGGTITIMTGNKRLSSRDCETIPNSREGDFVCISIEDTGIGISEELLEKIFEPFFSTKGPGKGTGLGLSVVYGIIAQHNGWINVESPKDRGSIFHIFLPAVMHETATQTNEERRYFPSGGNGETILLIEDQPEVIRFVTKALKGNGYIIYQATTGEEAKNIFRERKGEFNLIFSDVVLPDISGIELIEYFHSFRPGLPVLLSSGYTNEMSQWETIRERGIRFLEKPYSLHTLLDMLHEIFHC